MPNSCCGSDVASIKLIRLAIVALGSEEVFNCGGFLPLFL